MVKFEFLTAFQLTTFILGIVFSILTIAMVFFTLKRPGGYRNTFLQVLFTVILPMITFIMWFACVFAAYNIFEGSELYIMLLSIGCGVVLTGITTLVAWIIHRFICKPEHDEEVEEQETDKKAK